MTHDTKTPLMDIKKGQLIVFEPKEIGTQKTFTTAQKVAAALVVIVAGVLIWRFA